MMIIMKKTPILTNSTTCLVNPTDGQPWNYEDIIMLIMMIMLFVYDDVNDYINDDNDDDDDCFDR